MIASNFECFLSKINEIYFREAFGLTIRQCSLQQWFNTVLGRKVVVSSDFYIGNHGLYHTHENYYFQK
jgi:hypothetical protein